MENTGVIELEEIIELIDWVILELKLTPWNFDWEGNIIDPRDNPLILIDDDLIERRVR